jgi:hypothetical protein
MLYQDADDKILEQDIYVDLNEAERVGSSERVQIVAQVDRFRGAYSADGDWTSTKRFYITQDDDLQRVRSRQVDDIGEANMADGGVLVDFVTWAMDSYPADKYVLILSDHGMGWPGGWSDAAPGRGGDPRIPLASRLGDNLFLMELEQALQQIRSETGLDKFELIGLDACLMGQVEVYSALAPHARYAVASEEVEPSLGWAYTGFLQALSENPDISGAELSRLIVESYIKEDQRIVDDQARAEFLRQGAPMGGLFGMMGNVPAIQLASQIGQEVTLTAVDLSVIPELLNSLNEFAFELQQADQTQVASARTYAQPFTSIFGTQVPPSYIDLGHFVQLVVRQAGTAQIEAAAKRLLGAMNQAILAEKHGPKKPGATGFTVFFPNSQLYRNPVTGAESYTAIAQRFSKDSLWDDFLLYHYTGVGFEPQAEQAVMPSAGTAVRAPGLGQVQISPIRLSSQIAAPGQPVTLSADIDGENIGYIYLMVGYYDRAANSIFLADTDYLESSDTRELNGVYYPDWGEGSFTMEFEWEPVVFAISDGEKRVTALFKPQSYGATFEEAIYSVDGIYTFAESGESLNARLDFSNGQLLTVYGITGEGETGAPRQITPQNGDTFTLIEVWLDLDSSGKITQTVNQEGGVLTFGLGGLQWLDLDAAPGEYVVGFIVEDLDGNRSESYTQVTVE